MNQLGPSPCCGTHSPPPGAGESRPGVVNMSMIVTFVEGGQERYVDLVEANGKWNTIRVSDFYAELYLVHGRYLLWDESFRVSRLLSGRPPRAKLLTPAEAVNWLKANGHAPPKEMLHQAGLLLTSVCVTPRWDAALHELWFCNLLVKRYRQKADNQKAVLAAFEEQGWPKKIDDPIPGKRGFSAEKRLADTVAALNKHQISPCLKFTLD